MTIPQRQSRRFVSLHVKGPLVAGPRGEVLLGRVRRACDRGARSLTLDLRDVPLIDGGGVGLLLVCRETARRRGIPLRVSRARGLVRLMLHLSALLKPLQTGREPRPLDRGESGHDVPLLLSA
jgi:ABC-type transporter Mla MlaB component